MKKESEIFEIITQDNEPDFLTTQSSFTQLEQKNNEKNEEYISKYYKNEDQKNNSFNPQNCQDILDKYKLIAERTSDLIAISTFEFNPKFVFVSPSYEKKLGYTSDELLGKSVFSIIEYEEKKKLLPLLKKYLKFKSKNFFKRETSSVTEAFEFKVIDKNKKTHYFESTADLIDTNQILFVSKEITDRKKQEKIIKEEEIKYQTLFEKTTNPIMIIDQEGNHIDCNQAALDFLECSKEDFLKSNVKDFMSDEDVDNKLTEHQDLWENGGVVEIDYHVHGSVKTVELTVTPIFLNNKSMVFGIARDITSEKEKEMELKISKQEAEDILDAAADGIRIISRDFRVKKLNETMAEMAGINVEDGVGMKCSDMFESPDCGTKRCKMVRALKKGKKLQSEEIRTNTKGDKTKVIDMVTPVRNEYGEIVGIIEDFRDITDFRKTEEELKIKESAIASSINAIAITDLAGNIEYVNPSFMEMWDYKNKNEIIGKPIIKFWKHKGKYMQIIDSIINSDGWTGEFNAEKKDGSVFPVHLSATSITNEKGESIRMMASFIDITDRKEAEKELKKFNRKIKNQNIKLKKLGELKSAFLNVTSHELRTPMSSIKGYVQMVLKQTLGQTTEEQNHALKVVLRNTNRLDNLIQDILDVSRLESGTMKFIPEKTDISKMINDVQDTMTSLTEEKKIKLRTNIKNNIPKLIIDQDRIKQVIINLVNNALKFSEGNTEIKIIVEKKQEEIEFQIKDQGRGIPKDKKEKIFETFYQVDGGMDRKFGGVGLGLAISRGIILSHGGKIWVESKEDIGSTFKFTLPIQSIKDLEGRFKEIDVFGLEKDIKK